MSQPSTQVSRLSELQVTSRDALFELLSSTPLATVALVRDDHPVVFPTGFARIDDDLVIHGSTGAPWIRALGSGVPAAVSVTTLDGVLVARSAFESSFRYRSAVVFGTFERIPDADKVSYLERLTDTFLPGRVAELRASSRRELAATLALRLPITDTNWSLKVSDGWPEDPPEDVETEVWAGVVPMSVTYAEARRAPDCDAAIPVPESVRRLADRAQG
jgi:uncharacterized protein